MAYRGPSIQTHLEWLGLVQPVGLVVAPVVLDDKELYPESQVTTLADGQRRLADLLEERELESGHKAVSVGSFERFATEILEWSNSDIKPANEHPTPIEVVLEEYGEVLKPSHVVAGAGPDNKHDVLVQELPAGTAMDELLKGDGHGWEASPHHRFERLLKESEHPIGLLFNGEALRLIFAPRGESSGHITFPLEPMTTVAGRPMLGALQMLLGVDRMFSGSSDQQLPELLHESRKRQNDVSTRLAAQVLEALWELLLGFDEAERNAQNKGSTVLGDLPKQDPDHIYGGLITVLLRLVFLLYAEDEDLMPPDSLYGQHYSVSGLAIRLRQEADEYKGGMASRRGAWASLLSLFRLVYDGGGATEAYLPARHGELFDPNAYPFLEGRNEELGYEAGILDNLPAISDDVVEKVLSKLLWLDGERLSYRSLDVEQIGSVYEGIMGFRVEQAQGTSVGITHRPPRQKITISVVVNADELLEQPASKRETWLDDQAGVKLKLPAAVKKELKSAFNVEEVLEALGKRLSPHTPRGLNPGSLVLQPTAERRRSGSHYTPRSLTEPIVKEAFRPWLERNDHKPTAEAILDLKVCDPAMGSGAFLVATCRYLAGLLVEAWDRDGYPNDFEEAWDKDIYARRLVAQRCLYGVDKNPFAVNLARLSLWLVTLSKELPFTFVDHALKSGDSLVGYSTSEIKNAYKSLQLDIFNQTISQLTDNRINSFTHDNHNDHSYDQKKETLKRQHMKGERLRQAGDLMAAAFFNTRTSKEREQKTQIYLAILDGSEKDENMRQEIQEILRDLSKGETGIKPFHWQLEFPEVFREKQSGFEIFVSNPPYLGGKRIGIYNHPQYTNYLKDSNEKSSGGVDIAAYFVRKCFALSSSTGTTSLITTNTIAETATRNAGLGYVLKHDANIFNATSNFKWPGTANVWVSRFTFTKSTFNGSTTLNGTAVDSINSSLKCQNDPTSLKKLRQKILYSEGVNLQGSAFVFSKEEASALHEKNPGLERFTRKYINGKNLNNLTHLESSPQEVVDFGDLNQEEINGCEEMINHLKEAISKERAGQTKQIHEHRPWLFWDKRTSFFKEARKLKQIIAVAKITPNLTFKMCDPNHLYTQSIKLFADERPGLFAVLQSSIHTEFARFASGTMGAGISYSTSNAFDTFPLPDNDQITALEDIAIKYDEGRSSLVNTMSISPVDTYSLLHNPHEACHEIDRFRELHRQLDYAVLKAYDWIDLVSPYGFGLENLEIEDTDQLSDHLSETIATQDLFFANATEAIAFEGNLRSCEAIAAKTKLPWRYRGPNEVRDKLIARLIKLNVDRFEEEVAQGLHGKTKPTRPKKRLATPAKAEQQLGIGGVV